jgi:hypothetical protein
MQTLKSHSLHRNPKVEKIDEELMSILETANSLIKSNKIDYTISYKEKFSEATKRALENNVG